MDWNFYGFYFGKGIIMNLWMLFLVILVFIVGSVWVFVCCYIVCDIGFVDFRGFDYVFVVKGMFVEWDVEWLWWELCDINVGLLVELFDEDLGSNLKEIFVLVYDFIGRIFFVGSVDLMFMMILFDLFFVLLM